MFKKFKVQRRIQSRERNPGVLHLSFHQHPIIQIHNILNLMILWYICHTVIQKQMTGPSIIHIMIAKQHFNSVVEMNKTPQTSKQTKKIEYKQKMFTSFLKDSWTPSPLKCSCLQVLMNLLAVSSFSSGTHASVGFSYVLLGFRFRYLHPGMPQSTVWYQWKCLKNRIVNLNKKCDLGIPVFNVSF